ncbi:MAG: PAS domain S-box protein [Alkalispirochaeta sp.]
MSTDDRRPTDFPASTEVADPEARRLRTIFETAATAMAQADPDGKLTYVNRAFLRLWGADTPESVLGTDVRSYWRDPDEAARVVQEITTRDIWIGDMDAIGRDGKPFTLIVSTRVIRNDDGGVESMFATFIDITGRKEAERALARETAFQSLVADLSAEFASVGHGPVEPAVVSTLARLGEFFSVDRADLFRFSDDSRLVSSTASWTRDGIEPQPSELQRFPVSDAPWYVEQVLEDRCVLYVPDVTALPAGSSRKRGYLERAGLRSILIVPVYSGDDLYGFFVLDSERPLSCTDAEIHGIQLIARILATTFAAIEAHAALEQREFLLHQTERIGKIGSWNAELRDGISSVSWSPETYRILELDPEMVAPSFEAFLAAVHPEERDEVADAYTTSVADRGTFEVICRLRPSSDRTTYVRVFGINEYSKSNELVRSVGIIQDITETTQLEQQVRSNADKFRVLVNSSMEGYWLLDRDGRFLEVNEIACRMLGYTREEMLGMSIPDIEAAEKPEETRAHIRKLEENGYDRFETQHLRKDGTIVDVEVSTAAYTGEEGIVFFAFIQDITDRKRAETAIREREVAEEANRAKTVFLSNITHELRTPLNSIMGFGQILQFDASLTEGQTESVREILTAGDRLLALINGIIDLTRIESGNVELVVQPVGVSAVVVEALDTVRTLAGERRVRIDATPGADNIVVTADRERLRQVLVNLLTNAIRYNDDGGTVTVTVHAPAEGERSVRIEVADTGTGIPPDQQEKVFTSFDRVGREAGNIPGTGIGLVYSKRLIELMGGTIGFTSEVGAGSTFWVELPESAG